MVERLPVKEMVVGSSPTCGARYPTSIKKGVETIFCPIFYKLSVFKNEFGKHLGH